MLAQNILIAGAGLLAIGIGLSRSCNGLACLQDKRLRENLSEKQIDKMVADSFPASDPPSTY